MSKCVMLWWTEHLENKLLSSGWKEATSKACAFSQQVRRRSQIAYCTTHTPVSHHSHIHMKNQGFVHVAQEEDELWELVWWQEETDLWWKDGGVACCHPQLDHPHFPVSSVMHQTTPEEAGFRHPQPPPRLPPLHSGSPPLGLSIWNPNICSLQNSYKPLQPMCGSQHGQNEKTQTSLSFSFFVTMFNWIFKTIHNNRFLGFLCCTKLFASICILLHMTLTKEWSSKTKLNFFSWKAFDINCRLVVVSKAPLWIKIIVFISLTFGFISML